MSLSDTHAGLVRRHAPEHDVRRVGEDMEMGLTGILLAISSHFYLLVEITSGVLSESWTERSLEGIKERARGWSRGV